MWIWVVVIVVLVIGFVFLKKIQDFVSGLFFQPPYFERSFMSPDTVILKTKKSKLEIPIRVIGNMYNEGPVIIYSHGNATDIPNVHAAFYDLFTEFVSLGFRVVLYDYSGYGASRTAKTTETSTLEAIECVYDFVIKELSVTKLFLFGNSIGSVPTVYLAGKKNVHGVILTSPIASGLRCFYNGFGSNFLEFFDIFVNMRMIKKVRAPVIMLHGTNDEVISFASSKVLWKNVPNKYSYFAVKESDHNGVLYDFGIKNFVDLVFEFTK